MIYKIKIKIKYNLVNIFNKLKFIIKNLFKFIYNCKII